MEGGVPAASPDGTHVLKGESQLCKLSSDLHTYVHTYKHRSNIRKTRKLASVSSCPGLLGCGLFVIKLVMLGAPGADQLPSLLPSCWHLGFAHQQASVRSRYSPLQTDGGKVQGREWVQRGSCAAEAMVRPGGTKEGGSDYLSSDCIICRPCRYYEDIRQTVPASDQEMNSVLAELSRVRPPLHTSHL